MEELVKIVYIEESYIRYLFSYDKKVMYNKGQKRPYLGILFEVRGLKYYAPLSHPKEKFLKMKNAEDFMRIEGGELGAINFNNMIPVVTEAIIPIYISEIEDVKYKFLLINQLRWFHKNQIAILNKATKLYRARKNKTLRPAVYARCCDFALLESKSKGYIKKYN